MLAEEEGDRRIPIIIGGVEAQSIAIKLEGLEPPRPLTHDLFLNFARAFDVELTEVLIYKLEEGIFYSELVCTRSSEVIRIDSRTSDAVALALRFNCPIYTYEEILAKAGIVLDFGDTKESSGTSSPTSTPSPRSRSSSQSDNNPLASKTLAELQAMLDQAVEAENYERASEIRDEIKRRSK
ncbi:bifunctional nuclease family protein [Xiashengella succiniciproducens]|uniref:Bifunctional nuclease family protein n=1 Tax=Xiashengella succiniciproducens TaxID=2949635 RepID=A0A9J6ZQT6_9BACT|nr:bifunctional nuclease family protein [Alkaliflexus sp. Ai-910]URW79902.1 bifunctional nuclease family protein [Alkaliflexus sp. Ai-910]